MRALCTLLLAVVCTLPVQAQAAAAPADTLADVHHYDEGDGLSQAHATQILQDADGFLWLATWNGLNRFDGYEFQRMASQAGDGCRMPSDRIRDIWLTDDAHSLYCLVDEELYRFDTRTYRFSDVTSMQERQRVLKWRDKTDGRGQFNGKYIDFTDRQDIRWELRRDGVYSLRTTRQPAQALPQAKPAQVRCLARDRSGRIWVSTREDATLRLYDSQLRLLGYVRPDGRLQPQYAAFASPVYCLTQTADGTLWLGCKPGGLFRLTEQADGHFAVEHISGLPHSDVYDIKEDRQGRLWIATLGGGIVCMEHGGAGPVFTQFLSQLRVRFLHLTPDGTLLAATTEGLVVGRLEQDLKNIRFHRHQKEADRENSLSCNATMDVAQDADGHLYVSTESGGVCQLVSDRLLADTLSFRRLPFKDGWPTDVALSLVDEGGHLLITSSNRLIDYDKATATGSVYDAWFFSHPYRYSEAHPLRLDDGRWLIGTTEGAFTLSPHEMQRNPYVPPIVLTGVSIQNAATQLAVNQIDTLRLSPQERNLTLRFAALDYAGTARVSYAFRMGGEEAAWNLIGHDHTVTLLDLKPGTYQLWLRSTNASGQWVSNQRQLTIVAEPTFWETPWAVLLLVLVGLSVAGAVVYTLLYIRRIKRQHRETLEAYLSLLESPSGPQQDVTEAAATSQPNAAVPAANTGRQQNRPASAEDDAFMRRVLAYVEAHIDDSSADVGQMAEAAAVSRSGLQRKMKQLMGVTPIDFLREARIKRACHLLLTTDAPVSDVAYSCGFNDPKYFSRCFKQSTGISPTEYKTVSQGA